MISARVERWSFVSLALLVFAHVLVRAVHIPLVHDECTSFLAYAQSGHFLPFASMWDANNHYFNSALGALGYKIFGLHLLALRWASVLSYVLFAWSVWRIGRFVHNGAVRWCLWGALLLCPFALDFFSLFRGYGPAMALLLFALQALLRFAQNDDRQQLIATLLGIGAANGFLLALVPLWGVLLVLLLITGARKHLFIWSVLGALPFAGAAGLAWLMARMGLLYQGSTAGFAEVTGSSLMVRVFGEPSVVLVPYVIAFVGIVSVLMLWRLRDPAKRRSAAVMISALLLSECIGRVFSAHTLGLNYGEDRTALHTLLLAVLCLAFAADTLALQHRAALILALPLLSLPLRTLTTLNIDRTVLWPEQSIPDRFVLFTKALQQRTPRPLVVSTHRHAGLPWSLQCRMQGFESDANAHDWPDAMADVCIAWTNSARSPDHVIVDTALGNGLALLVRRPAMRTRTTLDTAIAMSSTGPAVFDLPAYLLRGSDLLVEMTGRASSGTDPIDLRLGITAFDGTDSVPHADIVLLSTRREGWQGELFHVVRHLPARAWARVRLSIGAAEEAAWAVDGQLVVREAWR